MYTCAKYRCPSYTLSFFFDGTALAGNYTLSLHDALPISTEGPSWGRSTGTKAMGKAPEATAARNTGARLARESKSSDRKSTRLNSSHVEISYAVFCLKKKKTTCCKATSCL